MTALPRRPGRPARGTDAPGGAEAILAQAQLLLDTGAEVTMRGLAAALGVTPMALYHHFADRAALVRALADRAYAGVMAPAVGPPRRRLAALIEAYHAAVLRHPALVLEIFRDPAAFPDQARRITAEVDALLAEAGLAPEDALAWRDILVDFTHGAALALALSPQPPKTETAAGSSLAQLLAALPGAA